MTSQPFSRYALCTVVFATSAALSPVAQAIDFSGYSRAGTGSGQGNVARNCYGLSGAGLKYRLGNECDVYAEFLLSQKGKVDNAEYTVNVMPALWNGATDVGAERFYLDQANVEFKGLDFAPGVTFWGGKRNFGVSDTYIVDTKFVKQSGTGAGASGIDLGAAKLAVSMVRQDAVSGQRLNADVYDIAVNEGGKLRVATGFVSNSGTGGQSGTALTLQHNQDKLFGGSNTLWLQYAQGAADLNTNFGSATATSDAKSWRVADSFSWQKGPLGGQLFAMWQQDSAAAAVVKTDSLSLGGRVSYAFTRNFKVLTELGLSQKKPQGQDAQNLTKFTIAPTLAVGPDFWARPELRMYMTHARWNGAANAAAGALGVNGTGDGKTSGTTLGFQVEVWW